MPGAEQQRAPQHRRGRRAPPAEQRQQDTAEQQLLGQRGGQGDADGEVVGGLAAADVGDAPVLEVRAGRGQGGPEGDDPAGHGGGAEPRAQPAAGIAHVDPEVGGAAAGAPGEAGEPGRGDQVQRRVGRRGQRPVRGEVVDGQHRHPDGLGRDRPLARHAPSEEVGSRRISNAASAESLSRPLIRIS
jgi:hypothetical protein